MIHGERDNGLDLNGRGEMGNTATAISTVDGRFFFVTDDTQTTEWSLIEIKDPERASINASEMQDKMLTPDGGWIRWWALEISHGSYTTFALAYEVALRVADEGTGA